MKELTYEEVAVALAISPRQVRRVVAENSRIIQPIIYSHRHVRFAAVQVAKLKRSLREEAIRAGKELVNGGRRRALRAWRTRREKEQVAA